MDAGKFNAEDYITAAKNLCASMAQEGFNPEFPIPIDPDGQLLDGAHRVACAIALNIPVHAQPLNTRAWAPGWGMDWFRKAGMELNDLIRLQDDFDTIKGLKQAA